MLKRNPQTVYAGLLIFALFLSACALDAADRALFNVKDYGATGKKSDDAHAAIQKAIDACAAAGGGRVYLPPGEYTSGTLRLRSHVRFYIDAGATLFASPEESHFDKPALLYGEDLQNIAIEGRGTVDGQAEYIWQMNDLDDAFIRPNMLLAKSLGVPLMRSFPKGYPTRKTYPHMIQLLRSKDVKILGLSFLHSPSWTINPYACERLLIDGVYIYTDQKNGVWADGIDPDGCKDVRISNSTIETGDDAIVFYSMDWYGPALPCENITITNCRLSSSSSALKFCDGNKNCVRNVTVDNCVITGSNRGIAFMVFDGGYVDNVVLSNLIVNCIRYDWYWWGDGDPIHFNIKRRGEISQPVEGKEPPAGSIRNVLIKNVIAHGRGSSMINGHPDSWLDHVSIENLKLYLSTDPKAQYDKAVHAMQFRWARNLKLKNVEVIWDKPELEKWQSALYFQDIKDLDLDDFTGRQARLDNDLPAVVLNQVDGALIRNSTAPEGTNVFVEVQGDKTRAVRLFGNDFRRAKVPYHATDGAGSGEIQAVSNFTKAK